MPWGSFLADGHTRVISRICLSGKTVLRANDTQAALREPGLTKTCLTGKGCCLCASLYRRPEPSGIPELTVSLSEEACLELPQMMLKVTEVVVDDEPHITRLTVRENAQRRQMRFRKSRDDVSDLFIGQCPQLDQ